MNLADAFPRTFDLAPVLGISAVCLCAVLISVGCTVAVQWRKARQTDVEAALKKEMIERGMSAEEIVQVVRATAIPADAPDPNCPQKASDYRR